MSFSRYTSGTAWRNSTPPFMGFGKVLRSVTRPPVPPARTQVKGPRHGAKETLVAGIGIDEPSLWLVLTRNGIPCACNYPSSAPCQLLHTLFCRFIHVTLLPLPLLRHRRGGSGQDSLAQGSAVHVAPAAWQGGPMAGRGNIFRELTENNDILLDSVCVVGDIAIFIHIPYRNVAICGRMPEMRRNPQSEAGVRRPRSTRSGRNHR